METITIDKIIAFTKEAMKEGINVSSAYFDNLPCDDSLLNFNHYINIRNDKETICFDINLDRIVLSTNLGNTDIETKLTKREKVNLESLHLDIKEYNKRRALYKFETFFIKENSKPTDITDLDNDDDD